MTAEDVPQEPRSHRPVDPAEAVEKLRAIARDLIAQGAPGVSHRAHLELWRKYGTFSQDRPDLIDLGESLHKLAVETSKARQLAYPDAPLSPEQCKWMDDCIDLRVDLRRLAGRLVGWGHAIHILEHAADCYARLEHLRLQFVALAELRS